MLYEKIMDAVVALNSMSSRFYISKKTLARGSWVLLSFVFYVLASHLLSRGLFGSEDDGFMMQIASVEAGDGDELGSLGMMHRIRALIVKPFILLGNRDIEPLLFFCYFCFLFFANRPRQRKIAIYCLIFSIFFSYRTVMAMLSIALLVDNLSYRMQLQKEGQTLEHNRKEMLLMLYAMVLSLLSTGVFFSYIIIFLAYRKLIVPKRWKKRFGAFIFLALFAAFGSVTHKFLFFTNPEFYGSATSVSMESFFSLGPDAFNTLFANLLGRSILIESIGTHSARVYFILSLFIIMTVLLILRRDRLSFILMLLSTCGMFMEGLTLYSLLIAALILIGQELKFSLTADGRLIWIRHK